MASTARSAHEAVGRLGHQYHRPWYAGRRYGAGYVREPARPNEERAPGLPVAGPLTDR